MAKKIAEVESKMFLDIKTNDPMWVKFDKTSDMLRYLGLRCSAIDFTEIKFSEDMKKGDAIRITIEKI